MTLLQSEFQQHTAMQHETKPTVYVHTSRHTIESSTIRENKAPLKIVLWKCYQKQRCLPVSPEQRPDGATLDNDNHNDL